MVAAKVYIAAVDDVSVAPVWPDARQAQLDATKNEAHRKARYAAWRLLEYALWDGLGLHLRQLQLTVKEGKWTCSQCFFSISHSGGVVAVAVSTEPVGVDIESVRQPRADLAQKICSPREMEQLLRLPPRERDRYLLHSWCKKESMFKYGDAPVFHPRELIPGDMTAAQTLSVQGQPYAWAITCREAEAAQVQIVENFLQNAK